MTMCGQYTQRQLSNQGKGSLSMSGFWDDSKKGEKTRRVHIFKIYLLVRGLPVGHRRRFYSAFFFKPNIRKII